MMGKRICNAKNIGTRKDDHLNATASIIASLGALKATGELLQIVDQQIKDGCTGKARRNLQQVLSTTRVAATTLDCNAAKANGEQSAILKTVDITLVADRWKKLQDLNPIVHEKTQEESILTHLHNYREDNKENMSNKRQKILGLESAEQWEESSALAINYSAHLQYHGPQTKPEKLSVIDSPDPPSNGYQYMPNEAIAILLEIENVSKEAAKLV